MFWDANAFGLLKLRIIFKKTRSKKKNHVEKKDCTENLSIKATSHSDFISATASNWVKDHSLHCCTLSALHRNPNFPENIHLSGFIKLINLYLLKASIVSKNLSVVVPSLAMVLGLTIGFLDLRILSSRLIDAFKASVRKCVP